ncbi:class D sortase [Parasporobacterium paucivorans]|uniref:Sortase A n=1 Tax=Parasporobacterium paucivorans DSM 15970 TaxID=1122934 RepID=A0A1M6GWF9_9FIRM|nr:class D sortase [Parasporobacterium paucivorans]SHJ14281.1 sortase A [Parasporobacterium paucivorans DSM 15970]
MKKIMKKNLSKIMAYFYLPLFFTLAGYAFIYFAAKPLIDTGLSVAGMMVADEVPDFSSDLNSIYTGAVLSDQQTIPLSSIQIPDYGTHYGNIRCERIGLDVPVYMGDDNAILRVGAGQFSGSFLPGFNRTILVGGHNTTFFLPLQYIQPGDRINYSTNYGEYIYEVTEAAVHNYKDTSAYDLSAETEQLILYTCYPFDSLTGSKQDRLFVYAKRLSGPDIE